MTDEPHTHTWGTAPGFIGPRHELREELLLDLFLRGSPGRRVLNIGAGQGSFTRLLEERGFDVVSTDVSELTVNVLRDRVRGEVCVADFTCLPFPDGSFDAVVAGEVLEHIEDDHRALSEAHRVIKPGGVIALSVPAHPKWYGESDRWAGHARRYSRLHLESVVASAGLAMERLRPWGFPVAAFYHRVLYDKRVAKLAAEQKKRRLAMLVLRVGLKVDRLFVGVELGCLGFLVLARVPPGEVSTVTS